MVPCEIETEAGGRPVFQFREGELEIALVRGCSALRVVLRGRAGIEGCAGLDRALTRAIAMRPRSAVLDARELRHASVLVIGMLSTFARTLRRDGCRVELEDAGESGNGLLGSAFQESGAAPRGRRGARRWRAEDPAVADRHRRSRFTGREGTSTRSGASARVEAIHNAAPLPDDDRAAEGDDRG